VVVEGWRKGWLRKSGGELKKDGEGRSEKQRRSAKADRGKRSGTRGSVVGGQKEKKREVKGGNRGDKAEEIGSTDSG